MVSELHSTTPPGVYRGAVGDATKDGCGEELVPLGSSVPKSTRVVCCRRSLLPYQVTM